MVSSAEPHPPPELGYAGDTEDADALAALRKPSEEPGKICGHPDVWRDPVDPEKLAHPVHPAVLRASLAYIIKTIHGRAAIARPIAEAMRQKRQSNICAKEFLAIDSVGQLDFKHEEMIEVPGG
jgi:hypothetical protein